MFIVGEIVNTHGLKGDVKVKRITDFSERFHVGEYVYMKINGEEKTLKIDYFRTQKNLDILHFDSYNSIHDVELFKGHQLYIKAEQLTPLPEHEYYYHEIIGCEVKTTTGDTIGQITSILSPGANDVWVVTDKKGNEVLIPYIEPVVKQVNPQDKEVLIEVMEGLLD